MNCFCDREKMETDNDFFELIFKGLFVTEVAYFLPILDNV